MYQLIVFLPLFAGIFGKWIGDRGAEYVTCGLLGVCFVLSWIAFFHVAGGADAHVPVANWFTSGKLSVAWALKIDTLTAVMLIVVTTVSFVVHVYSIGYMAEDPSKPRFFAYLSLFTFAMLMLVTADNLVQLFFGWEGVGLMSYLLIGFWYEKPSANAAAIKAFVVNRVGDFGFSLGIFLTYKLTGSVTLDQVFAAAPGLAGKTVHFIGFDWDAATLVCLLLFMGAMGKSAQFLLHTWLPDAMEGPTPVSALIHAATMVTAGVFMVARLSPLFEFSSTALSVVLIIGGTTTFFAATIAVVQPDIKKVIAYSTCSQLGYMFVGCGVGGYSLGIFHLFTHGFFKACLFLCAGSVITAMHHEQDMRRMGGLRKEMPVTFWMMMAGSLALSGVGIPFTPIGFAGFVSKDPIIEAAFVSHRFGATYAFWCADIAAGLTALYTWRLMFIFFFGKRGQWAAWLPDEPQAAHGRADEGRHDDHPVHESPPVMLVPLGVLALGAVFAGMAFRYFLIGAGHTLLPLDDVLGCLKDAIPNLSRSALRRCGSAMASPGFRRRRQRSTARGSRPTRSAMSTSTVANCVTPTANWSCSWPSTGSRSSLTSSSMTAPADGRLSLPQSRRGGLPLQDPRRAHRQRHGLRRSAQESRGFQPPLPRSAHLRSRLHSKRQRAPLDQALPPVDQRPG
jgi:NADH-quinone oxidoreductase subunit L